jgi:hypothetical protein
LEERSAILNLKQKTLNKTMNILDKIIVDKKKKLFSTIGFPFRSLRFFLKKVSLSENLRNSSSDYC